ncbi:TonB-dependent receptor [Nevskia ramosa]|uniref:TonB-dependent receptor n=1 Tax=Nevskia ramosa TaxID=64002 RepID=UPI00041791FC|nr:TonB-dependent receptor [Nevskia ramosa]
MLSAGQRAELCTSRGLTEDTDRQTFSIARRNVEGGGRTQDYDRYQYRIITGLRGDFLKNWSYDASIQFGSATYQAEQGGYFSLTRLSNAINITTVDGVAQCASGVAGCVPYNIFGVGTVSPEALNYLSLGSLSSGSTTEQVATGAITGSLGDYGLKSPFAENGVGVSFGGEYRRETARFSTDEASRSGDLAGAGGAATAFDLGFAVKEVFAEIKIPLIERQPFFEELSAEAGYRRSDYSSVNSTNTYKIAGEWAPTKDIRFRGGFNRAVRAPSIGDISDPTTVFLGGSSDPCAGLIDPETGVVEGGATRAQCLNDPLIAQNPGLYGAIDADPAAQYNARGGTGGLKSETAKTYTAGVVLTPTFIRNFTLSVDYFDIKVDNIIGRVGADTTLGLCYTSGLLCDRINRNPNQAGGAFGSLFGPSAGFTDDPISNQGFLLVRGIDLVSAYRIKLSQIGLSNEAGSLAFDMVATRSLKQDTQAFAELPDTRRSCNGQYGPICGTPAPLYRHKLRATYSVPVPLQDSLVSFSGAWRYLSGVNIDSGSAGGANDLDKHVSAESYIDMTASVTVSGAYTFRLGVQNVFDNNPPVIGSTALSATLGNGNTYPQVYDALGRYVFAGVTVDF